MSNLTIGIDVDNTTLDSSPAWWNWLWHVCDGESDNLPEKLEDFHNSLGSFISKPPKLSYDLSKYFGDPINHNMDKFEFWRHTGVYDTIKPIDGAVENIKKIMERYHVVFVTHNKGNGGRSKHMNLVRLFGNNFDYVVTKEKHMVKIDYLIDDRLEFLNPCHQMGIHCIQLDSIFHQTQDEIDDIMQCSNWDEVYKTLQDDISRNELHWIKKDKLP